MNLQYNITLCSARCYTHKLFIVHLFCSLNHLFVVVFFAVLQKSICNHILTHTSLTAQNNKLWKPN